MKLYPLKSCLIHYMLAASKGIINTIFSMDTKTPQTKSIYTTIITDSQSTPWLPIMKAKLQSLKQTLYSFYYYYIDVGLVCYSIKNSVEFKLFNLLYINITNLK